MAYRLLIVEDELPLAQTLAQMFKHNEIYSVIATSAEQARSILFNDLNYDLILLDWKLPGISGNKFLYEIRNNPNIKYAEKLKKIPVIMLTALDGLDNKVDALTTGADDYINKPFANEELIARIKGVIRRTTIDKKEDIVYVRLPIGTLILNGENHQASIETSKFKPAKNSKQIKVFPLRLTDIEFRLLQFLAKNQNRVYSREKILDEIWGDQTIGLRSVDVVIKRIRNSFNIILNNINKKALAFEIITTVRSVGYAVLSSQYNPNNQIQPKKFYQLE